MPESKIYQPEVRCGLVHHVTRDEWDRMLETGTGDVDNGNVTCDDAYSWARVSCLLDGNPPEEHILVKFIGGTENEALSYVLTLWNDPVSRAKYAVQRGDLGNIPAMVVVPVILPDNKHAK